jgi:hypothetical protein
MLRELAKGDRASHASLPVGGALLPVSGAPRATRDKEGLDRSVVTVGG